MSELPNWWTLVSLNQVADIEMGQSPESKYYNIEGIGLPFFQGKTEFGDRYPTVRKWCSVSSKIAQENDILLSVRAPVGPTNITKVQSCIGRGLAAIKPSSVTNYLYLFYFFRSIESWLSEQGTGSTFSAISGQFVNNLQFPLAPINEQTRIVAKLEELFSDLDAGVNELKAAQAKLVQYRQSLLKAAVEGELSREWRESRHANDSDETGAYETGERLLERILIERRKRWEEKQLARFNEQGKQPPKDWQKKYPEPVQPDTSDLPKLPDGWVWASLDMIGDIASGVAKGSKVKPDTILKEVPYLRVANVQRGYLDLSEIKTILATEKDIQELKLESGDLLFNEGGDRDKLGRGWVWRNEIPKCIHQNHVFRARLYLSEMPPELVSHHANTFGKLWFQRAGKQTTNLASINMTILKAFPVPIAPINEQQVILDAMSDLILNIDRQEKMVEASLAQSAAQRKNILGAAFAGELVPQDPNDEPASELLARIQAEREAQPKVKKTRLSSTKQELLAMPKTVLEALQEANDWLTGQELAKQYGIGDGAGINTVESFYAELRELELNNKLEVKPDSFGFKRQDKIRLKDKSDAA